MRDKQEEMGRYFRHKIPNMAAFAKENATQKAAIKTDDLRYWTILLLLSALLLAAFFNRREIRAYIVPSGQVIGKPSEKPSFRYWQERFDQVTQFEMRAEVSV